MRQRALFNVDILLTRAVLRAMPTGEMVAGIIRILHALERNRIIAEAKNDLDEQWNLMLMERMGLLEYIPPIDIGDAAAYRLTRLGRRFSVMLVQHVRKNL
ncbi:hypothetical protein HYZ97_03485 [Candidatus Pacearchaeota archaeon]|nr:hypothetical protein [Candidatus Pacearchaeota archaeon]